MVQSLPIRDVVLQWTDVCLLVDIQPNTGVGALIDGQQVAVFRIGHSEEVYAISNYDPFSKTYVLSRGIVGDRKGILKVASPIYKQNFNLKTGECLDDATVKIPTYPVRVLEGKIQVGLG